MRSSLERQSRGRNAIMGADQISEKKDGQKKINTSHDLPSKPPQPVLQQGPCFREGAMDQAWPVREGHMTQVGSMRVS